MTVHLSVSQDAVGLTRELDRLVAEYKWTQGRSISTQAFSRLLSTLLYSRRGMPYYADSVIAGLDARGAGAVYGYDPVGSFERLQVACGGGGRKLMQPVMDRFQCDEVRYCNAPIAYNDR